MGVRRLVVNPRLRKPSIMHYRYQWRAHIPQCRCNWNASQRSKGIIGYVHKVGSCVAFNSLWWFLRARSSDVPVVGRRGILQVTDPFRCSTVRAYFWQIKGKRRNEKERNLLEGEVQLVERKNNVQRPSSKKEIEPPNRLWLCVATPSTKGLSRNDIKGQDQSAPGQPVKASASFSYFLSTWYSRILEKGGSSMMIQLW